MQVTTHWPSQNVAMFPKIGPGYYSIDKDDKVAQDAYMERLNKFKVHHVSLPMASSSRHCDLHALYAHIHTQSYSYACQALSD